MRKKLLNTKLWLITMMLALFSSGNLWADDYKLYSGAITEGDYLIVYDNGAMKAEITSSRFTYRSVSPSNNIISNPNADIVWHIAASSTYWTLYNSSTSKYAASTGVSNKGALETSVTDYSKWSVTGTSTYEFVNKKNNDNTVNKNLRRNGTYGFACYSTSTGGALKLYKKTYTVTYNANGGTGTMTDTSSPYFEGSTVTTKTNTFTRTNYDFAGWNTKADGTGTSYAAGATFTLNENTTLYAQWTSGKTAAGLAYAVSSYNVLPNADFSTPTLTNPNGLTVTYSSSDSDIALVNSSTGAITIGTKEGTATITASSAETSTYAAGEASYTITVAKGTTTVTLNETELSFNILDGATKTLTATAKYNDEAIDGATVSWQSSNTSVATVTSAGVVTPVAPGTATITASYAGTTIYAASNNTCAVTVNKANTTLTLDETSVSQDLKDARTFTLTPTVKATKSDDSKVDVVSPTVTWTSSDESVATVSGGVVTGLKAGTITITASYAGGDNYNAATNATCSVAFTDTRTAVSISTFTAAKTELLIGDVQATTITNDQAGWTAAYTYSSSNESVATVDTEGKITAVSKGTATITATVNIALDETGYKAGDTASKTLDITVTKPFHTATFWVNGDVTRTASVEEDQAITFPTAKDTPADASEFNKTLADGRTFQGWYTAEYSHATTAPASYVNTSSTTMSTSDLTYYAVYAEEEESDGSYTLDYSNESTLSSATLGYGTEYEYTASDGSEWVVKAYKNAGMQINTGKDSSIKMPVCPGNIQTVKITCSAAKAVGVSTSNYSGSGTITYQAYGTDATSQTIDLSSKSIKTGYIVPKSGSTSITKIVVEYKNVDISNFTTDNRSAAGLAYTSDAVDVKLTSGYTGQALTNPNSLTVSYSSSDETVATVNSSTGATELLKAGSTTITATFAGNATYKPAEVSYTLNVTEKTPAGLAYATSEVAKVTTDDAFTNTLTNGNSLTVSYSSSATGVATVNSSTGEVTIKGAGETTITASFAGNDDYEAGNASYTLTVSKATPTLSFASDNAIGREGESFAGNALTNPASLTVTYSSSATDVATVNSSTGAVTIVAAGTTTITASFAGNDTYASGSASYTLKVLATPTITVSDDEVAYGETFTYSAGASDTGGDITLTSGNTSIATVAGLVITPVACGEVEITVSRAETDTYKADSQTFTLTVTAPAGKTSAKVAIFEETFAGCDGTGANDDNGWSGSVAGGDFVDGTSTDNEGWIVSNAKEAYACAKFGTGSAGGSATTPEITLEEGVVYTLTFKAGAWDGKSEGTSLSVSAENATIKNEANTATVSSVTTSKGSWKSYTLKLIVTDESDPVTITFSTDGANKRFFLDDVKVEEDIASTTVTLNKYGYATYCSQYPMDFSSTSGYTAWRVSSIKDGVISFTKITEKIKGGQGVLLYNKNADGVNTSSATIKFADGTTEYDEDENLLVGTTAPTYFVEDSFYGLSGNQFKKNNTCTLPAGKAYLPYDKVNTGSGVRNFTFVFEDDVTGIETIQNVSDEVIFDLTGRRLNRLQKGVNIVNGKKILVK